eukprot:UN01832
MTIHLLQQKLHNIRNLNAKCDMMNHGEYFICYIMSNDIKQTIFAPHKISSTSPSLSPFFSHIFLSLIFFFFTLFHFGHGQLTSFV